MTRIIDRDIAGRYAEARLTPNVCQICLHTFAMIIRYWSSYFVRLHMKRLSVHDSIFDVYEVMGTFIDLEGVLNDWHQGMVQSTKFIQRPPGTHCSFHNLHI